MSTGSQFAAVPAYPLLQGPQQIVLVLAATLCGPQQCAAQQISSHCLCCCALGPKGFGLSSSIVVICSVLQLHLPGTHRGRTATTWRHVNEDGLEREAVRAAARQHVSCHGGSCDDNKELAS